MPDPIHAEDGSPLEPEAQTERAFTHPMSAHGTDPNEEPEKSVDPRMAMIEEMADQNNAERMAPAGAVLNGLAPEVPEGYDPEENVVVAPIEAEASAETAALPDEYANNPLADFIVMDGETPMFKTVYQGQEKLIPLENAQREMQKHVAADIRLQQNTEWQRNLEEREAQLQQTTAALNQSLQAQHESPPSSPVVDVDDEALQAEALEVVSGLFTGSEDEAAAKLADLLRKTRSAPQAPSIDPNQLVQQAVQATRQQLSEEARQTDVNTGFKKFSEDYPDIMADQALFGYADSMTDDIAAEHPEWMPSEVMLEAGKRVREWVQSMKAPEQSAQPTNNDRLERKQQLRPLPRVRQGTQEAEPIEQPQTPAQMMDEIRAARGQIA